MIRGSGGGRGVAVVLSGMLVPLVVWPLTPDGTGPAARPVARSAGTAAGLSTGAAPSVAPDLLRLGSLRPGDVREYELVYRSTLTEPRLDGVRAVASLVVTCYAEDARGGLLLGERWTPTQLALEPGSPAGLARELEAELLLRVDPRRGVAGMALPVRASGRARDLLRAWAGLPLVIGPERPGPAWSAPGWDPSGPCQDRYRVGARSDAQTVLWRSRRYDALRGLPVAADEVHTLGGARLTLDPDGALLRLELEETIRVEAPRLGLALGLETVASLRRTGAATRPLAGLALEAERLEQSLGGPAAWALGEEEADPTSPAAPPAAPPLEAVLQQARALQPEQLVEPDGVRLFLQLVQCLERDPAAAARLLAELAGERAPARAALLLDALGEARTAPAREALLAVARAPLDPVLLPNLYLGLGQHDPVPELLAALRAARDGSDVERATWALHGLAAVAARGGDLGDTLAAELEAELARATPEGEPGTRRALTLLDALGNAGRARSVPCLLAWQHQGAPQLRAAAARALRAHAGDPRVDAALERLRDDAAPEVRAALAALAAHADAAPLPSDRDD